MDHHVDLGGAVEDGAAGLERLGLGGVVAERKADHGAHPDRRALKQVAAQGDP